MVVAFGIGLEILGGVWLLFIIERRLQAIIELLNRKLPSPPVVIAPSLNRNP